MAMHQILACTADGRPHQWMSWQDAVTAKYKGLVAYEFGDDDALFHGGTSRMTGERSIVEVKSIIAIRGEFKFRLRTPALTNQNLFKRDLHLCGYCGRFGASDSMLTRDHIHPVSKGGKDVWTNVITACKKCNNYKDDKMLHETDLELRWVPYTPTRDEQLIMQNRNILFDQAKFLLDFVPEHSRMKTLLERKFGAM